MTEFSFPWTGTVVGDHGPYSSDQWQDFQRQMYAPYRTIQGVMGGNGYNLNPNFGLDNATMNTGAAMVDGTFYQNDAQVTFPFTSTVTYYRIVLRKTWATQEVRAAMLSGIMGGGVPALTQTDGVVWEIPIATFFYMGLGSVLMTDERTYCFRTATQKLFVPVSGSSDSSGLPLAYKGALTEMSGGFYLPENYLNDASLKINPIFQTITWASGTVQTTSLFEADYPGAGGSTSPSATFVTGTNTVNTPVSAFKDMVYQTGFTQNVGLIRPKMYVRLEFYRNAGDSYDNYINLLGWMVEFNTLY